MGVKLKKIVTQGGLSTTTEYAGNFIYENGALQFFSHPEGYVTPDGSGGFDYVYQFRDHVDNIRLSYTDANGDGSIDPATEIIEENNFYPFGMLQKGYNNNVSSLGNSYAKKFKYQGQELGEGLDYDMFEFQLRPYDPALGRFVNTDPYEQFMSPYLAMGNNPVVAYDPTGGRCFDANGNQVACPDDSLYDDYRDSDKNHITILDEVVGTGEDKSQSSDDSSSSNAELVDINSFIGTQVLPARETKVGRVLNAIEPRTVTIDFATFNVDADGIATGIRPLGGSGGIGLIGGLGTTKLLKFRGLVQNLKLRSLTHQQLVKAFRNSGLVLSGHSIKQLKSIRTQKLGINTLNDFKQIINKGSKFNAGKGAVGFSHKGVEVIINPKTKVLITIRPAKNIR